MVRLVAFALVALVALPLLGAVYENNGSRNGRKLIASVRGMGRRARLGMGALLSENSNGCDENLARWGERNDQSSRPRLGYDRSESHMSQANGSHRFQCR